MKRIFHLFPIVIALTAACILLAACRAKKEVAEANLSENAATVNSTVTGNAPLTSSVAVQPDTNYWQLVYPKTAKTEGNLWRKGEVYTLDTNEASWTVDTTFSVNVHISIKLDESDSDFTHMDYSERLKCPRGKPFVKFIDSLNQNKDVKRVDYHIPPILIKEKSPKTSGKIYKIRRQYYTNNRYGVFGRKIEKKWVDVYVNGKQEKEKIAVPADMKLEEFVDSLERRIDIDSIAFIGIFEIISDDIESIQSDKY